MRHNKVWALSFGSIFNGVTVNLKSSLHAKSIGARFRSARSLVPDLNRKSFCERYEINRYTMQSWENGLHVSKGKNVEKFIEALAREGIACTSEWLIDGIGEPARPFIDAQAPQKEALYKNLDLSQGPDHHNEEHDHLINLLISGYASINRESVKMLVLDESMSPKFRQGDWLIGTLSASPAEIHQKFCIVELGENRYAARKVYFLKDHFLLTALDERIPSFNLALGARIYEIVWHILDQ